jgi:hypothetical protein
LHSVLIEVIRLKLPRTLKTRFDKEFKEAGRAPTAEGAVAVASTAAVHRLANVKYTGQKSHEAKALAYLKGAQKVGTGRTGATCPDLMTLGSRLTQAYLDQRESSSEQPYFVYMEASRTSARARSGWRVAGAAAFADHTPVGRGDAATSVKKLLEQIREREQARMLSPFLSILGGGGGPFDPFDDGYDDDEDYDDYEDDY